MLNSLNDADLNNKSNEIYTIINNFFIKLKNDNMSRKEILSELSLSYKNISLYDSNERYKFKEKLIQEINK